MFWVAHPITNSVATDVLSPHVRFVVSFQKNDGHFAVKIYCENSPECSALNHHGTIETLCLSADNFVNGVPLNPGTSQSRDFSLHVNVPVVGRHCHVVNQTGSADVSPFGPDCEPLTVPINCLLEMPNPCLDSLMKMPHVLWAPVTCNTPGQ